MTTIIDYMVRRIADHVRNSGGAVNDVRAARTFGELRVMFNKHHRWLFVFVEGDKICISVEYADFMYRHVEYLYCDPEYWSKFCVYLRELCDVGCRAHGQ